MPEPKNNRISHQQTEESTSGWVQLNSGQYDRYAEV